MYQKVILMHRTALSYLVIKRHDDYIKIESKDKNKPLFHKVSILKVSPYIDVKGLTEFYKHNNYVEVISIGQ